MTADVSDNVRRLLDVVISWMLKIALDWFFAGLALVEQNGVWQLRLD